MAGAVIAAEVARRAKRHKRVTTGTRADAARFGWTEPRAAYEARVAKRAATRRKRKVIA